MRVKKSKAESASANPYNQVMYMIAIAWIYVTLLMAATEPSITAGVLTFSIYGLVPLALFLWLFGTPQRNRQRAAERLPQESTPPPEQKETDVRSTGD